MTIHGMKKSRKRIIVDGITDSMDVSLSELQESVLDREAWRPAIHGVAKSRTRLSDWTELNYFIILFSFCHTFTWVSHGCTCFPHPDLLFLLPPHPIPQGHPSAPALSTMPHASKLDWWSISHVIIYMFQCYSLKSSHPLPLPQSPKHCSIYLYFFCCLAYSVIVTIFLNSIYTC